MLVSNQDQKTARKLILQSQLQSLEVKREANKVEYLVLAKEHLPVNQRSQQSLPHLEEEETMPKQLMVQDQDHITANIKLWLLNLQDQR